MFIFRIKVCQPGRPRFAFTGIFKDGFEAVFQTQADYPGAVISAMHITGATT